MWREENFYCPALSEYTDTQRVFAHLSITLRK